MKNAAAAAFDWAMKDTIDMARVEAGSVAAVKSFLAGLESDLVGILASNKDIAPGKKSKLNKILAAASDAIGGTYGKVAKAAADDNLGVAHHQAMGTSKMVNMGVGVDVMGAVLTESQLAAVASKTLVFGHSSGSWWAQQEEKLRRNFAGAMSQGYALGEDVDQLVRRVRGTKAGAFKDGIMQVSRREAEAIVRSSIQTISNAAALKSFEALGDTIKGIEWLATLDTRTTHICKALDGKVWRTPDLQPVGHDKVFPGPTAHWNCRSRQIPVLRSWEELSGKKIKALDGATFAQKLKEKMAAKGASDDQVAAAVAYARASMDGQASGSPPMQRWMENQTSARIKQTLGPSRAKLFNEGKITVTDLTDQNNRPLTVAQLVAGIEDGGFPETEGLPFEPFDPDLLPKYDQPAIAVQVQTSAQAKIETVLANPKAPGNSIMSSNIAKVQAAEPSLTPAEIWAKAEEITAAKIAANTKSSVLSKAKKKILADEAPTAAQQAIIDDMGDDEKAAWLESVADAKKVAQASTIQGKAAALKAKADAILAADPLANAYTGDMIDAVFEFAGEDGSASMLAAADVESYIVAKMATNKATATLDQWKGNPAKEQAIAAALAKGGSFDHPVELVTAAEEVLTDIAIASSTGNKTAAAKKAMKALTGMDSPAPASLKAWLKTNKKDAGEFLAQFEAVTKEKLDQSVKSSVLSKAKKKIAAGDAPTAAQQVAIDSLTPEEKANFDDDVGILKAKDTAEAKLAEPPPVPSPSPAPVPPTPPRPPSKPTVPHPDKLKVVGKLGGTTGAQLAEDADGNRYVIKRGASPDHVRTEQMADDLYRALGIDVPIGTTFETDAGPVKVTKFVEGGVPLGSLTGKKRDAAFEELRKGFAADAMLANWDVAGTGLDNVLVTPDGKVWRIDNGGSLQYRAQGSTDGKNWDRFPDEFWTMRTAPNISAPIFGPLDIFDLSKQVEAIDWSKLNDVDLTAENRAILDGRVREAKHFAGRALDFGHDGYQAGHADGVARATVDVRKAGISNSMPTTLQPKDGYPWEVVDGNGVAYGNLRTAKIGGVQNQTPKVAGDVYAEPILSATKALASCANGGKLVSSGSAPAKMVEALKYKSTLTAMAKTDSGATTEQQAMATVYLAQLDALEKISLAGGIPASPPPMFEAFKPAAAPKTPSAQDAKSVVKQWEAVMATEGINVEPIYNWLKSQSGNSWTTQTQAMKVAFAKSFADPEKAFYWDGNGIKASWTSAQKHYKAAVTAAGGEAKMQRLMTSWHAVTQELLSEIDAPWIDRDKRAVLLYRTVKKDEMDGSFSQPDAAGVFTPKRGTTESHSIYKTTSIMGNLVTVQAVPFSRVLSTYWTEKPTQTSGGGFLGDHEAEFAANTSGLQALRVDNFKAPGFDDKSKNADTWGVPTNFLRP